MAQLIAGVMSCTGMVGVMSCTGMAGGTKSPVGTRTGERFKDGLKKTGGTRTQRHAGPGRPSKTCPTGVRGVRLQKRAQP